VVTRDLSAAIICVPAKRNCVIANRPIRPAELSDGLAEVGQQEDDDMRMGSFSRRRFAFAGAVSAGFGVALFAQQRGYQKIIAAL
jgi:hypothetical protein